jgi:hypothetical protein
MWEAVILRLLQENDFVEILSVDNIRTKRDRGYFLEMRGRGTWHQIDCPCDYSHFIPFVNPLRLLGEVKFYRNPVQKNLIREFIGTVKDIQENYFVSDCFTQPSTRYTELGAYFSANGFDTEAERLAFAHNIKTISYKNVEPLDNIKSQIEDMERNYVSARICISAENQQDFIRLFREILSGNVRSIREFMQLFQPADGFDRIAGMLAGSFEKIRSNFIASSSGGALLHFVGTGRFPDELFSDTDAQLCRVFYEATSTGRRFYLVFANDGERRRFYFSPPVSLAQAAFFGGSEVFNEKERIFHTLHISRHIKGLLRTLILKLDQDWLDGVRRAYGNGQ